MNEPLFKIEHLDRYKILDEPCTAIVDVRATIKSSTVINSSEAWFVPLRVVTKDNIEILKEMRSVPYSELRDYFISGVLWADSANIEELPIRGEKIIASFDYIKGELRCVGLTQIPRKELPSFLAADLLNKLLDDFTNYIEEYEE
ncbi:MAG: hypothetical protein KAH32_01785 [Chlamydiia bacterium]|nr:hypothetical protein [Chlamydiia bacterium]